MSETNYKDHVCLFDPFYEWPATLGRLLSKLSLLDLTHLVDRSSLRFRRCGGCSDIYIGILHLKGSPIKIAVKKLRFNIQADPKFARVGLLYLYIYVESRKIS